MVEIINQNGEVRKMARKSISKKTRFEVFKRDGFKCQYCGISAPDAVLHVDHIDPVSKGGAHDMFNFLTSCQACNSGKSDRILSDESTLQKQRAQLQDLNERREQLEMLLQWRAGLESIRDLEVDAVCSKWAEVTGGWDLNDLGRKEAKSLIKKFTLNKVLDALELAGARYVHPKDPAEVDSELVTMAWRKVGGILNLQDASEYERGLHYIKGILRNRLSYVPFDVVARLRLYLDALDIEDIKGVAKQAKNWTGFLQALDEMKGF